MSFPPRGGELEQERALMTEAADKRDGWYEITRHARQRARERNFNLAMVPKILESGEYVSLSPGEREWVLSPNKWGKPSKPSTRYGMAVVTVRDYEVEVVKTVYFVDWYLWLRNPGFGKSGAIQGAKWPVRN